MRKTAAFVVAFLLTASLCIAAGYYRELLALPRAAGSAPALSASVLLHFDEESGSTNIVDSGKYGLSVTSLAGAQTTNNPTKFGNVAGFDNTQSRRFLVAWTNDFWPGTNDWSIDCWIYADDVSAATNLNRYIVGDDSDGNRSWFSVRRRSLNDYRIILSTNGTAAASSTFPYDVNAVSNAWMHLAVWRKGDTLYAATNGGCVTLTATNLAGYNFAPTNTRPLPVGTPLASIAFYGIDEFRYCFGDAMKYGTTNFVPPSAPYTGYE